MLGLGLRVRVVWVRVRVVWVGVRVRGIAFTPWSYSASFAMPSI